jgi:hypothetical protein
VNRPTARLLVVGHFFVCLMAKFTYFYPNAGMQSFNFVSPSSLGKREGLHLMAIK